MTSPEIAELVEEHDAIALIPIGSIEQHGPHLPVLTDSMFAENLARLVAERLPAEVLVAPVLHLGLSSHHVDFPGTITVDRSTFEAMIVAHIEAARRIGLRRVAIFSGHGGNFRALAEIASNYTGGTPEFSVVAYSDLARFLDIMLRAGEKTGLSAPETDVHAGALETSFSLKLFPQLVRSYSGVRGYTAADHGWLDELLENGARSLSNNGVFGLPELATEAAGVQVLADLVDELCHWLGSAFLSETDAQTASFEGVLNVD